MITILFVDDEANVLDGLRRMLRPLRHEWEMKFVDNGNDALTALSEKPYDIIVSDIRMPGMDGVELLTEVMRTHPGVIRLALSGHGELEKILEAARVAHQYQAKPCNAEILIDTVKRACALRALIASPELESELGGIDSLPSLPKLYADVMDEIANPNSDFGRVGEIISKDVSMSTKIMQLVNSSFFGVCQHVSSPRQAVSMLGLNTIKGLAITTQAFTTLDASVMGFDMENLWCHSGKVATLAARIATLESGDTRIADHALVAGLLHDIGKLVLATKFPDRYQPILPSQGGDPFSALDAEYEEFGCSHAEVGAYLVNLWGFSNPIVEALAFHHAPHKSVGNSFTPLTAVHVANVLLQQAEDDAFANDQSIDIDQAYLQAIGKGDQIPVWVAECHKFLLGINENQ
jgi:putative nucleotidyltransferase with HDIG domain